MTKETLLEIDDRRPFQPYSLHLNNGDVVRIEQPEHCLITEDEQTLVWNQSGGRLKFIAIANIAMIEENGTPKRAGKRPRNSPLHVLAAMKLAFGTLG